MSERRSRPEAERPERPEQSERRERPAAGVQDVDAEGRPLPRQEDEAAGTGAPGVDVGRPDAMQPGDDDEEAGGRA